MAAQSYEGREAGQGRPAADVGADVEVPRSGCGPRPDRSVPAPSSAVSTPAVRPGETPFCRDGSVPAIQAVCDGEPRLPVARQAEIDVDRAARRSAARRRRSNDRVLRSRLIVLPDREAGMATAEYAIATLAAVGFAALLVAVLSSGEIKGLLMSLITSALNFG
ncbi:DUF4244 domain-containing protein [Arthrobacter agilis]|uniref:DUF4244 domain-containing protein n=1 Tax=Arthrobacter agilis TaxID=37921 RepID=UPI002365BD53|nr:DUF4244 domain-containing protein [Arthrobacter agilis]WDF32886.1 DUF4244 domain-containing protein [Arthrobacter agilis]